MWRRTVVDGLTSRRYAWTVFDIFLSHFQRVHLVFTCCWRLSLFCIILPTCLLGVFCHCDVRKHFGISPPTHLRIPARRRSNCRRCVPFSFYTCCCAFHTVGTCPRCAVRVCAPFLCVPLVSNRAHFLHACARAVVVYHTLPARSTSHFSPLRATHSYRYTHTRYLPLFILVRLARLVLMHSNELTIPSTYLPLHNFPPRTYAVIPRFVHRQQPYGIRLPFPTTYNAWHSSHTGAHVLHARATPS